MNTRNSLLAVPAWRRRLRSGLVAATAVSFGALFGATATAQDNVTPDADDDDAIDEIVTTGSRIPRSEFTSASPVQIIDMENSTLSGLVDVTDVLQGSTVAANATQINNLLSGFVVPGGSGVNTLDLRGLGAGKTLVLLNGRRLNAAGTRGTVASVDLNTLPASVIKRVEILKDGASSIYGSDAVAGVVNIITRDDLDGFAAHYETSVPTDSGGEVSSADLSWGFSNDNANIVVGLEWLERSALKTGDRDWSSCFEEHYFDPDTGDNISTIDPATGEIKCWNSPANDYVVVQSGAFAGRWIRDASVDCAGAPPGTCVQGWRIGSLAERKFNNPRQANADVVSPNKRLSFFSIGDIDLDTAVGDVTAYYEYMYNSRRSQQHGGPRQMAIRVDQQSPTAEAFSPFFSGGGTALELPLLLPFDDVQDQEVNWTRALAGLTGEFGAENPWIWDVHYSYGRSHGTYRSTQMLIDRVTNMMDIVEVSPGVWDCAINLDPNNSANFGGSNCVPFNPYGEIGQIDSFSPDVLDYMTSKEVGNTTYTQNVIEGYIGGRLFDMPAGEVGAVLGLVYREEKIDDTPSSGSINGNLWGFTSSGITKGNENVAEAYVEFEVPLVRDVTGFQDLTLQLSGRYTDYKTVGDDTTYKVGLNWQIVDQLRLRSSFGTSFRAPALFESFLGGQTSFSNAADPCTDWDLEDPASNVFINCQNEGLPAAHAGFTSTPQVITFGNAGRLQPETSEALTVGAVLDFASIGLSFAIDFFDYEITDEITRFGSQSILTQCYDLDPSLFRQQGTICDFASERNPVTFNIADINDSYFNINSINVDGFDLTIRYDFTIRDVEMTADFRASKIETWDRELFGGVVEDLNGTIGQADVNGQFDLRADFKNWTVLYGIDWIGDQEDYTFNGIDPSTSIFVLDTDDVIYHDLSTRYQADRWSATLGLTNISDEDPPIVSDVLTTIANTGAAFHTGYRLGGRTAFLSLSANFGD